MTGNPSLAMVALRQAEFPSVEDTARFMKATWPDAPLPGGAVRKGNVATFHMGEAAGALTLFPMPIPWSQLEGPCSCAWYWPGAEQQMQEHTAHAMVALLDDSSDPVAKAMRLTQLVAAVAQVTDAVGIFWGGGGLVHAPDSFLMLARRMTRDELPLYLWIDFRIDRRTDGPGLTLFTTGLEALGQKEIETQSFDGQPQELLETAFNVAHYLLDKKQEPNDGDTMGLADGRRLVVHHDRSMLDPNKRVLQLEF